LKFSGGFVQAGADKSAIGTGRFVQADQFAAIGAKDRVSLSAHHLFLMVLIEDLINNNQLSCKEKYVHPIDSRLGI